MVYSETRIVIGGLTHVPVLIFIANFIKGKFVIETEETKDTVFHEEKVKIIEVRERRKSRGYQGTFKKACQYWTEGWWGLWKGKEEKKIN